MGRKKKVVDEDDDYAPDNVGTPAKKLAKSFIPSGDNMYDKLKGKWAAEDCYRIAEEGTPSPVEQITLTTLSMPNNVSMKRYLEGCAEMGTTVPLSLSLDGETGPITLQPFASTTRGPPPAESADVHDLVNVFINAGGPVWATSVRPFFAGPASSHSSIGSFEQYIAIGTSRVGFAPETVLGTDKGHTLGEAERYDNMLQLWKVHGSYVAPARAVAGGGKLILMKKKTKADDPNYVPKPRGRPRKYPRPEEEEGGAGGSAKKKTPKKKAPEVAAKEVAEDVMDVDDEEEVTDEPSAEACTVSSELCYCVALKGRGPSWSVEWCPFPPSDVSLGVVAVVNGDGSCLILDLPRPSEPAPEGRDVGNTPVYATEGLALCTVSVPGVMVTSVTWSPAVAGQFACGMEDGSVTVWHLQTQGATPGSSAAGSSSGSGSSSARVATTLTVPSMHFVDTQQAESQLACMAAVRAVKFCPYDAALLLAAGQDDVKIWSLKDYTAPVFSKKMVGPAVAAGWDACGFGYYTGDCETTALLWNPLWGATYPNICRRELYAHALQYGAVWALRSLRHDDHSLVLTAGSDGTVRGGYTAVMTSTKSRNLATMELCKVLAVTEGQAQPGSGSSSSGSAGRAGSASTGGRVLSIGLRDKPTMLALATGEEKFPEVSNVAWQCIDAIKLPGPTDKAPVAVGKGGKKGGDASASSPLAEVILVAYGSTTGLVRVHTLDPMRVLFAGTGADAVAETK